MLEYARTAAGRGLEVVIAGAGGRRICRAWWLRPPLCR